MSEETFAELCTTARYDICGDENVIFIIHRRKTFRQI